MKSESTNPLKNRDRQSHEKLSADIFDELRVAEGPMTTRNICWRVLAAIGQDPCDKKLLAVYIRRTYQRAAQGL
jgi:hypothetical protein